MTARPLAWLLALASLLCVIWWVAKWNSRGGAEGGPSESVLVVGTKGGGPIVLENEKAREPERTTVLPAGHVSESAADVLAEPERASASIEVSVLWDRTPLIGTSVDLCRFGDEIFGFLVGDETSPITERVQTDGAGIARFTRVPSGRLGLLASGLNGVVGRVLIALPPDGGTVRVVVPLGAAGLEGTVYDLEGRGDSSTRVLVRQDSRAKEAQVWFVAKTQAGGTYRLGGMAGGTEHPITAMARDVPFLDTDSRELALDEWRTLDFGFPGGPAKWSGVVRLASGRAIPGPGRLFFAGGETATSLLWFFDGEGRFDVTLPRGSYEARLGERSGLVLGSAEVIGVIQQDLVCPGITLHGRVTYVGTKHPMAKGPENEVSITLERGDRTRVEAGFLHGEGRYGFFGLKPGSYVLTTSPWCAAGTPDGRVGMEIGASVDEVVFDLSITDP